MPEAKARDLSELPDPSSFGNFWFGVNGSSRDPAIFLSSISARYVAMKGEAGMVWENGRLAEFDTPLAALKALRKLANGRGR